MEETIVETKIYKSRLTSHSDTEEHVLLTTNSDSINSDFLIVCTSETMPSLIELSDKLRNHDWTFEMSDDYRYWSAGTAQLNSLRILIARHGSAGKRLFHFFYPEDSRGSHRKEDYLPNDWIIF